MAIRFFATKLGYVRTRNTNGRISKSKIEIRTGNCMSVFIYSYRKSWHLWFFIADAVHLRRMYKEFPQDWLGDNVFEVWLNVRYQKQNALLEKYLVMSGYRVRLYYE